MSEELSDQEKTLNADLEAMKTLMADINSSLEPLQEQAKAITAEEQQVQLEYQAKVAALRASRREFDEKIFEFRSKFNEMQRAVAAKERELKRIEDERKREELRKAKELEMALLNEKWDLLTAGATWREWAKEHQLAAGHYITEHRNVILADPMGLGKTLSAIITCDMTEATTREAAPDWPFMPELQEVYNSETGSYELKAVGGITRPVGKRIVYICPSSLMRNVRKEFNMWAKHRNVTFLGGMTKSERNYVLEHVLKPRTDFVVIVNYEAWRKDMSLITNLIALDPDTIILDEAHAVKDTKSIAYRGVKQLLDGSDAAYVIPMTGTPILNRPQELFSLLTLVNPNDFYHLNDFLYNFCEQDSAGFWKFQPGGLDRVAKKISKNFLRRSRDQAGIELPEKTIINHDLEVDVEAYPNQADVREQMRKYATIMIDAENNKAVTAAAVIAMFTRLRQIETWPAGIVIKDKVTKEELFHVEVEESQKVDYVISSQPDEYGNYTGLIPESIDSERIVLFSQFKAPLHEIKNRVEKAGYRAVVLDGSVTNEEREQIANDFDARYTSDREKSRWDVVLCNYKVGGVGFNFTAATQLIALDEEWNPGKRDQAFDRIHRMGQEKPVTIHIIRNQKTIDDWLAGIMESKEGMVEGFNNTMININDFKDFLDNGGLI